MVVARQPVTERRRAAMPTGASSRRSRANGSEFGTAVRAAPNEPFCRRAGHRCAFMRCGAGCRCGRFSPAPRGLRIWACRWSCRRRTLTCWRIACAGRRAGTSPASTDVHRFPRYPGRRRPGCSSGHCPNRAWEAQRSTTWLLSPTGAAPVLRRWRHHLPGKSAGGRDHDQRPVTGADREGSRVIVLENAQDVGDLFAVTRAGPAPADHDPLADIGGCEADLEAVAHAGHLFPGRAARRRVPGPGPGAWIVAGLGAAAGSGGRLRVGDGGVMPL
jgi:hypothetical protein